MIFLKKYLLGFLTLIMLSGNLSFAGDSVRVALFYKNNFSELRLTTQKDGYKLYSSDSSFIKLKPMTDMSVFRKGDTVIVKGKDFEIRSDSILIVSDSIETGFFINTFRSNKSARVYTGDIEFFVSASDLRAVNVVPLEKYVAATVEAEGGYKKNLEYYKTQAVICRTYVMSNVRHDREGFDLCDGVHCQAYYGKAADKNIIKATKATKGKIIVDTSFQPIHAVYHSNSGGITANSADVWSSQLPYLVSVRDTFSLSGRNAIWKRTITFTEWRIFLETKGVDTKKMTDEQMKKKLHSRIPALRYGAVNIPTREIREYFNLKSAYFNVDIKENTVILSGKGYGHGVGLSQEGAMRMAALGYSYQEIISHYYRGAMIVDKKLLNIVRY